ncbi:hypothetical protein DFQ14_101290 [Halopolyspora algeriensis]|uniref:Protein phosphatase 2C-like protein n=1 Tax=Halopolyspora algeriensis TaxID=1500506 RepID=A0A368W4G6_9ACTN|nr:hypothetical protein [Halopolyspora algeriensis]RCW46950.1 hypothetical protein DFQ14_101290 [Halopolyspora algeriensis]TQM48040.1 hypothetical protein FHU43_2993 [Halopolyspora algeriensis]
MPSVEVAEQAGTEHSEDVVLTLPNAVALLDGATSLRPTACTGGWYAGELAAALRPRLTARTDPGGRAHTRADLADLLAEAIAEVATTHGLQPGHAPSSTVAVLRWDASTVEALVLADSPIVVLTDSGEHPVTDNRLTELRSEGRGGYRERLRSGGGFGQEHDEELRAAVDATGRWRNVEGGFWVAEAEPRAAHRAVRASWSRARVRAAVLASDGVSCGVDDYGIYRNWSALYEHANDNGTHAVLDRVRAAEESDPDGRRWPRPKRHDDQALALVRFRP